VLAEG